MQGIAHLIFGRYVFAFEVTSRAAHHRRARRDGARPPRAAHAAADPARAVRGARALRPRRRTCPAPASTPGTTRSAPRRCCPTARRPTGPCREPLRGVSAAVGVDSDGHRAGQRARRRRGAVESRRRDEEDRVVNPANYIYLSARAVQHRRVRRARPPQRDRRVHVRRAHAQRQQPRVRLVRPDRTATSTARSSRSSSWSWRPPRSWSGLAIIMTIFRTRRSASVDEANLLKY